MMDAEHENLHYEHELSDYSRPRKYDRLHAEILHRVRQYFQQERDKGKAVDLWKAAERTTPETGASIRTVRRLKTINDVDNWPYTAGEPVSITRSNIAPSEFSSLRRKIVRDILPEKKH